jgi:hypothetical protein
MDTESPMIKQFDVVVDGSNGGPGLQQYKRTSSTLRHPECVGENSETQQTAAVSDFDEQNVVVLPHC